jgi:hypothetical protein
MEKYYEKIFIVVYFNFDRFSFRRSADLHVAPGEHGFVVAR